MANAVLTEIPKVTARTYSYRLGHGRESMDFWKCPTCGRKNDYKNKDGEDTCLFCDTKVSVVYRRIHRKNF